MQYFIFICLIFINKYILLYLILIKEYFNNRINRYRSELGIAGLDCWIGQSGLQSILLDWIVIDNPISKLDFDLDWQSSKAASIQIQKNW